MTVDARATDDAWAIGSKRIIHWDGSTWNVALTDTTWMDAVHAAGPGDVWAVGPSGRILHWDGAAWAAVPSSVPSGLTIFSLVDIDSSGPDDVWAIGSALRGTFVTVPLIEHWDGTRWSVVYDDQIGSDYFSQLTTVSARAADDVWAVGMSTNGPMNHTLTMHWDGTSWSVVPSVDPDPRNNQLGSVTAVSATDAWAVGWSGTDSILGHTAEHTLIEHWDGTAWHVVPSPSPGTYQNQLSGVAAVSSNDVWAVGFYDSANATGDGNVGSLELAEHWDGTRWTAFGAGTTPGRLRLDLSATPTGVLFAAGGLAYQLCETRLGDASPPDAIKGLQPGYGAAWSVEPSAAGAHAVTDATGLGLFDSGPLPPGGSFAFAFPSAGVYRVVDGATGVSTSVSVGFAGDDQFGPLGLQFALAWAAGPAPAGDVYDVQVKRPGTTGYTDLLVGTTDPGMTFTPDAGVGAYVFHARLRNPVTGAATGWSGPRTIGVG